MEIHNITTEEGFENRHDIKKAATLRDDDTAKIVMMELESGDVVKDHSTPFGVSFLIHKGEVEMKIDDEIETAKKGDLVSSHADVMHGFENKSDQTAQVLVIQHI